MVHKLSFLQRLRAEGALLGTSQHCVVQDLLVEGCELLRLQHIHLLRLSVELRERTCRLVTLFYRAFLLSTFRHSNTSSRGC